MKSVIAMLVGAALLPGLARAQGEIRTQEQAAALGACLGPGAEVLDKKDGVAVLNAQQDFEALGFGGGFGGVFNFGSSRVNEAELVAGIVRVKEDNDIQFGPILELHKFVWPLKSERLVQVGAEWVLAETFTASCKGTGVEKKVALISMGPFVPIRLREDVVESFGAGLAFGFRKAEKDTSLNLGLAVVFDPRVQVLGDGIKANQPLPSGETAIRYRTTSSTGLLAMFSVGW